MTNNGNKYRYINSCQESAASAREAEALRLNAVISDLKTRWGHTGSCFCYNVSHMLS